MKRWIPAAAAVCSLAGALCWLSKPVCPENYSGTWYSADTMRRYTFYEGLISCDEGADLMGDGAGLTGAYSFSKGKLLLFDVEMKGMEKEKLLYLVSADGKEALCDRKDGSGRIFFYRNTDAG